MIAWLKYQEHFKEEIYLVEETIRVVMPVEICVGQAETKEKQAAFAEELMEALDDLIHARRVKRVRGKLNPRLMLLRVVW